MGLIRWLKKVEPYIDPTPKPATPRMEVTADDDLVRRAEAIAFTIGLSRSGDIILSIYGVLKKYAALDEFANRSGE